MTSILKFATIVGARPQFVKAAMISQAIAQLNAQEQTATEVLVHTGQHYDYEMSDVFFETLSLPSPAYNLGIGSGAHGAQTGEMLTRLEEVLLKERPDVVVVFGDTNSTLAGALAAAKQHFPVAHVEAGLRSFNRLMPEEINRVLTDHVSDLLFVPTPTAVRNLEKEGITDGVLLVGDVMQDAAWQHVQIARTRSRILHELRLLPGKYVVATVHRAENTDSPEKLKNIVSALQYISESTPVVWPTHPRTREALSRMGSNGAVAAGLQMIGPLPYPDMLLLEASASVVLTDSGGVQKEAGWFSVPCVTLRDETEWVETLETGWNRLAGSDRERIVRQWRAASQLKASLPAKACDLPRAAPTIARHLVTFAAR